MEHKVEVYCNDEDQDFDIEIALPDYEFDDLIKIMMEKHDICYDDPEKVVFFTEFNFGSISFSDFINFKYFFAIKILL